MFVRCSRPAKGSTPERWPGAHAGGTAASRGRRVCPAPPFRVEYAPDPALLVRAMDEFGRDPAVVRLRAHGESVLALRPGDSLLDVGSGTGDVASALASHVAPGGLVVGVDRCSAMVAEARRREASGAGDGDVVVEFWEGDGAALPFLPDTFSAARCERTLQHVADPGRVVAELLRVVRSGGRIHLIDTDWETLTFNHPDRERTRRLTRTMADHAVANGWAGRRLLALLRRRGLVDLQVAAETVVRTQWDPASAFAALVASMVTTAQRAGIVTAEDARSWLADLAATSAQGGFFSSVTMIAVGGRKA